MCIFPVSLLSHARRIKKKKTATITRTLQQTRYNARCATAVCSCCLISISSPFFQQYKPAKIPPYGKRQGFIPRNPEVILVTLASISKSATCLFLSPSLLVSIYYLVPFVSYLDYFMSSFFSIFAYTGLW